MSRRLDPVARIVAQAPAASFSASPAVGEGPVAT